MESEIEYNPVILAALHGNKLNYPEALAINYPRIFDKIVKLWGSPEFDLYIRELMLDDRGTRQGFSPIVGSDILYLGMVHTVTAVDESLVDKAGRERKSFSWKRLFFGGE